MVKRGIQAYACPGVTGSDLSGVDDSVLVTITVTENWVGSKKGFKAKKGDPDSQGHRYLGFNWPQEGQSQHRSRSPLPETAKVDEVLTLPVNTAEPFTERDFMDEMCECRPSSVWCIYLRLLTRSLLYASLKFVRLSQTMI
jgi:hypothetical protein